MTMKLKRRGFFGGLFAAVFMPWKKIAVAAPVAQVTEAELGAIIQRISAAKRIDTEFDAQMKMKMAEIIKDFEKTVLLDNDEPEHEVTKLRRFASIPSWLIE